MPVASKRYSEDAERASVVMDKERLAANKNTEADIEDLPPEITESYGTGVEQPPEIDIGEGELPSQVAEYTITTPGLTAADEDAVWGEPLDDDEVGGSPELTGGDIDAAWDQAATVGDEAVGGTAPTPDQSIVDEIGAAVGLEMDDYAFLRTNEILEERDDRRWELDPTSSEDYQERRD